MTSLITKLEAATEGSRELDAEIARAVGWRTVTEHDAITGTETVWRSPDARVRMKFAPPNFTMSIDEAISLIPPRHTRAFGNCNENDTAWACLTSHETHQDFTGEAVNEPLALCIAALRARSQP